jgi:hypothetical protein
MTRNETWATYWKSDIQAVIYDNFSLVTPDIVEQVHHNPGRLIPYQFVISLVIVFRPGRRIELKTDLRECRRGDFSVLLPLFSF